MDPNGAIAAIVEIMSDYNEMIRNGTVLQGNLETGNQTTVRTSLPSVGLRALNQGVPKSKSTTEQQVDTASLLEGYSEIDKEEARINGNSTAFMASETVAFLEAMSQEMERLSFYGDTRVDPKEFLGLASRYSALSTDRRNIGYNVTRLEDDAGSAGSNTSLWIVTWGPNSTYYFLPKVEGAKAGFEREWLGQETDIAADGSMHEIYRTHYIWRLGLTVKDWRANYRIANIDTSAMPATSDSVFEDKVIDALHRIRKPMGGRTVILCNEIVASALDKRAASKGNVHLAHNEWMGREVTTLRGIPIVQTDGILSNEGTIA